MRVIIFRTISAKTDLLCVYSTVVLSSALLMLFCSPGAKAQSVNTSARLITSMPSSGINTTRPRRVERAATAPTVSDAAVGSIGEIERLEKRAFELVNAERVRNGENPLIWDEDLCRLAREHSSNMAQKRFFNHVTPDGRDMVARARSQGIQGWHALAENIALNKGFDDPAGLAVERWMQSTMHRTNILYAGFNHSAIGIARAADGTVYLTQDFVSR
jgi:uncharacterized protein YkwD